MPELRTDMTSDKSDKSDLDTLSLAKAMIACPSVTPHDHGCQDIVTARLKTVGFTVQTYQFNETTNFWAIMGDHKPVLCFAGHTDVVPPGEVGWISPPFTPTERDGYLVGRGAADMKSSVAAMVTACERFIKRYPDPKSWKGSIAFLITSDEEGPAHDGTQAVLKKLSEKNAIPEWCLVGEASSSKRLGDTIKVGRRGSLTGKLVIKGIQGHVAYPELGKNAIHLALKPLAEITQLSWDETIAPFPKTTLQISNIHGGTGAQNVIPGSVTVDFNLRFSPNYTPEFIQQRIEQVLKTHQCEYDITWTQGGKPFLTDPNSAFIRLIMSSIEQYCGQLPEASTSGGTSDGRFFAEYGTQVVEVGPINATIHQVNERIGLSELTQLSALYEKILEDALI